MRNVTFLAEKCLKTPVSDLIVGMFIESLDRKNQLVSITNSGLIKSQADINTLIKHGVKYVWVDLTRSTFTPAISQPVQCVPVIEEMSLRSFVRKQWMSRDMAQVKAGELLSESKRLIQKVLFETFEGKAIEIAPFENLADNMINMMCQDLDALSCMSALRNKDAYLLEHSVNVAFLLLTFGRFLKLEQSILKELVIGGILHDIGKIKVDINVLNKPGKLTNVEFEHIKSHQNHAIDILSSIKGLSQVSKDVCLMHHEKLDGKGYPLGLSGDEISLYGRMSCIVDIFDALTASRSYKEAMSPAAAFKILLSLTPFHLDKTLIYDFIRCVGIYPVGSLVELSNGLVGIVWTANKSDVLHPIVKCFYSVINRQYVNVRMVDLSKSELYIERGIVSTCLNIDPTPFY
ncbi:HD-GYP domain-containing protein [uncultured Shewanella sp.]|uniref:HD-GYP domain-containing protein n=1 Tax=uncultured Shewanella sp. TaxID=173975 RepID=UPI00260F56BF|nr:HD-GYP domain-containing protein [uncultured Shewanella sp.]